jgi:16S rRNA (guanine966-N2)-methyltransferase
MRVIAGSAKGVRLGPVPPGTRPLSDRAREGLFASLGARVVGARCLDLFAGTGAIGIEALSRGALACTFVDRAPRAVKAIRGNLDRVAMGDQDRVHRAEVATFLGRTTPGAPAYDLVFLDPPYGSPASGIGAILRALDGSWLPLGGWTVVLTRGQKGSLPALPLHWAVARQLRYGDSLLTLYREVGWA